MADDESTSVLDDSALEADDDVSLEDIEVSQEELDSINTNNTDPDVDATEDDELSDEDDTDEEVSEDELTEDTDSTEAEPEEATPEQTDAESQKALNDEMAKRRIAERQARDKQLKDSQQQYLEEAADPQDEALRQQQIEAYDNRVDRFNNQLTSAYNKALQDFPVFQDTNPVVQRQLDRAVDAFQAQHVSIDEFGNPTDVRGDFYAFLQEEADVIQGLTGIGAKQQAQSKGKQKSKTLTTPSRSPKEPKVDPDVEAFDEEADW